MGNNKIHLTSDILCGDAWDLIHSIEDKSINLILTSPPYNIGKPYEKGMFSSLDDYAVRMEALIAELSKKITDDGSICWQVGNHIEKGSVYPLDILFFPIFRKYGFELRNRIVWTFNFGLHAKKRFSGRYETILWFTKSNNYKFNLDEVRVPQLYPGKRHAKSKVGKAGKPSGNPLGKNPADFWQFDPSAAFDGVAVWEFPNVKANHPENSLHPCQFPNELADRCILALTDEGDRVLDPFSGVGTTVVCADLRSRSGVGFELDAEFHKLSLERLEKGRKGELPLRPSGKPTSRPNLKDKVAVRPSEWGLPLVND